MVKAQQKEEQKKRVRIFEETLHWHQVYDLAFFRMQAATNLLRWTEEVKERLRFDVHLRIPRGHTVVYVEEVDCLRMVKYLTIMYGVDVAMLNFANSIYPGGGVRHGAAAQEENIFRRTDCWNSIKDSEVTVPNRTYTPKMTSLIDGQSDEVYIDVENKRVCTRDEEDDRDLHLGYEYLEPLEIFSFIEVRAAAVNLSLPSVKIQYDATNFLAECTKRIDAQFKTLIKNNVRHVVLGAFGCGAFRNQPRIVAQVYMKAINKYKTHFDVIGFPIIMSPENLKCFKETASTERIQLQSLYTDLEKHKIDTKAPFARRDLAAWQNLCEVARRKLGFADVAKSPGLHSEGGGASARGASAASATSTSADKGKQKQDANKGKEQQDADKGKQKQDIDKGKQKQDIDKVKQDRDEAGMPNAKRPTQLVPHLQARFEPNGAKGGNAAGSATSGKHQMLLNKVEQIMATVLPAAYTVGKGCVPRYIIQPLQYLSAEQAGVIKKKNLVTLEKYIDRLPCWVPATEIATAFGHNNDQIYQAIIKLGGPYLWAPEFELQLVSWTFQEPRIVVKNRAFKNALDYYNTERNLCLEQKGSGEWAQKKDQCMRQALESRFSASTILTDLLLSTHPHKLMCIGKNPYWQWTSQNGGENKLALLLMQLRSDLLAIETATAAASGAVH